MGSIMHFATSSRSMLKGESSPWRRHGTRKTESRMGPTAKGLQSLVSSTSRVDSTVRSLQPRGPRPQGADVTAGVPVDDAPPSASLGHHAAGGWLRGCRCLFCKWSTELRDLLPVSCEHPSASQFCSKSLIQPLAAPELSRDSSSASAMQGPARGRVEGPGESELQQGCPDLGARKREGLCVRLSHVPRTRARLLSLVKTQELGED